MVLTLEEINKRLTEIPQQLSAIQAEQNQLLGYKQALADAETEATPKNGEVVLASEKHIKEVKKSVAKKA